MFCLVLWGGWVWLEEFWEGSFIVCFYEVFFNYIHMHIFNENIFYLILETNDIYTEVNTF